MAQTSMLNRLNRIGLSLTFGIGLLTLGCATDDGQAEQTDEQGENAENAENAESSEGSDLDEPCPEPVAGVAPTYTVELLGFPGIVDNAVTDLDLGFEFEGDCVVTQSSVVAGQLELALACDHSDSDSATVTLTAAATEVPAGLIVHASVTLSVIASGNVGGDMTGGEFRSLTNVINERYEIHDDAGLVFAALRGGLQGSFGSVDIDEQYNCPNWTPCSAAGEISGSIHASSEADGIDVEIGEVGLLEGDGQAWDVSLFQARLGDCHSNTGEFSLLRRG